MKELAVAITRVSRALLCQFRIIYQKYQLDLRLVHRLCYPVKLYAGNMCKLNRLKKSEKFTISSVGQKM